MSNQGVIDRRVAAVRAALEACAEEGFDPSGVALSQYTESTTDIHARNGYLCTRDEAYAILARLAPEMEPEPFDVPSREGYRGHTSYSAGGYLVYAELRPDARTEAGGE